MENKFNELGLHKEILNAILEQDFTAPSQIQEKAIPLILEGKDLVGLSQTGTGKTLAFVAPVLQEMEDDNYVQAIVLCPTRELAQQILVEVKKYAKYLPYVKPVAVFGGADMQRQIYSLKRGANFVIGTPGRLLDHINRRTIKLGGVRFAILDEADEMLNMGFRDDIEEILSNTPKERQTTMFSATMSKEIMALTKKFMNSPIELKVGDQNATISTIKQTYFITPKDKKKRALHALLKELPKGKTLVFCNTKVMVDGIQVYLRKMGYDAMALHGDMPQSVRRRVLQEYRDSEGGIMITTDIAARGIDVQDILHVINFDLPQNKEYYVHRVGRTGRAGKTGFAWTLLNTKDQIRDLKQIEKNTKSTIALGNLSLDGINEIPEPRQEKPKGHNLNVKKREQRHIGSRNFNATEEGYRPTVRSRFTKTNGIQIGEDKKYSKNNRFDENGPKIQGRSRVVMAGSSKKGTKTQTVRTIHKSKKQNNRPQNDYQN